MHAEFRLFGEVSAAVDGRAVALGPARQRSVLAVLLIHANEAVAVDQLVDRVWGERPPHRAMGTLRSYLSRLRAALQDVDGCEIERGTAGYVLYVDRAMVDVHRFRDLVTEARSADDDLAAKLYDEALALWRARPFAGLDTLWVDSVRDSLEAERFAARLDHHDVRLRQGRHTGLVTGLTKLATGHPLDERLAGQLVLALYRSGRTADALMHYDRIRRRLADELGTDPSPPLRLLHQQILTAEPALNMPAPPRHVVPRQLPAPPPTFIGRQRELDVLDRASRMAAISGTGGVGKTSLALQWAHRHLDRFPDGQLHVNLRGFDPTGEPTSPAAAVERFLHALGIPAQSVPADADEQVDLYRSLVAGRRMLIMLDNARDTAQVLPLLPGGAAAMVIVTSRHQLAGLVTTHHALPLPLDVLEDGDARAVLATRLGEPKLAAEAAAVTELLHWCQGLPLALSIVAARAALQPNMPLAALVDELRQASTRLGALDTGELTTTVRAVFSWSYDALRPEQAEVFRLLGLAPGPDIGLPAAASLTALSTGEVRVLLRDLEQVSLVQQHSPGRYRMHDLVRIYAAERVADGDAGARRLIDFYVHTALASVRLLNPNSRPLVLDGPLEFAAPAAGCVPETLADEPAVVRWFDQERPNLLAAQQLAVKRGWHVLVWQLAWTLHTVHWWRGHLGDHFSIWLTALDAAQRLGHLTAQAVAHRNLGDAHSRLGAHDDALADLRRALDLAEQSGDVPVQALVHQGLALAWERHGDDELALPHAETALRLYRTCGNPVWEAQALNGVGWLHARLGRHAAGRTACEAALALSREHGDRGIEADTLDSLGYIAHHSGEHADALGHYHRALELYRDFGDSYDEANTLDRVAHTHDALGDQAAARAAWHRALELYRAQHRLRDAQAVELHL